MSRRPATIVQSDIARIIRAAKQAGAAEVEVRVNGQATVVVRLASPPLQPESTDENKPLEDGRELVF